MNDIKISIIVDAAQNSLGGQNPFDVGICFVVLVEALLVARRNIIYLKMVYLERADARRNNKILLIDEVETGYLVIVFVAGKTKQDGAKEQKKNPVLHAAKVH